MVYLAAIVAFSQMNVDGKPVARTRSRLAGAVRPRPRTAVVALCALVAAVVCVVRLSPAAAGTCDRTASPSSLSSAVSAASAGQTICLGDGSYGTWSGANKAITLRAAPGVTATMAVDLGAGDSGFTLDGLSGMGGMVTAGAHDFVIRNSTFTSAIVFDVANANILLDHNSHDWNAVYDGSGNGKIIIGSSVGDYSGVTVQNSTIRDGDLDGVHIGAGVNVLNNVFANLCDRNTNHTDNIQFEGARGGRIAGNYVYAGADCMTQGITSYDSNTFGVTIEDNVVDIRRPWGIEFYSDTNSVIRHNTVRWYADADCEYDGIVCGQISLDHRETDPPGVGTQVYDNIATDVNFDDGSDGTAHHNVSGQRAVYEGPLETYAGFKLAPSSPVGVKAASDGLDAGARITSGAATPTPPPGPPPDSSSSGTSGPSKDGSAPATPSGLVAAFGFDERAGAAAVDATGAGPGTIRGAKRTSAGKHGKGLRFDGVDDYVKVRDSSAFDLTTGMTLEAWVRPTAFGRRAAGVIVKQRPRRVAYGLFASDGSRKRLATRVRVDGNSRASAGRLPLRRWTHVAATYDGTTLRLYRNGILRASRRVRGGIDASAGSVKIGAGFKGTLDDVRVWRVALSAAAIRADSRS